METFNVSQCLPIAGADPASLQLTRPQRLSVGKLSCSVNVMVKTKVLEHFQMPRSWSMKKSGLVNTCTISWDPGNLCIQTQVFTRNYWRMGKMEEEGKPRPNTKISSWSWQELLRENHIQWHQHERVLHVSEDTRLGSFLDSYLLSKGRCDWDGI